MKPGTVLFFPHSQEAYTKTNSDDNSEFFELGTYEVSLLDLTITENNPKLWIEFPSIPGFLTSLGWKSPSKEESLKSVVELLKQLQ